MSIRLMINVGCGRTPTVGWLNFDNSFTVRLARFPSCLRVLYYLKLASKDSLISAPVIIQRNIAWADATTRLPLADESVAVVYSSHMLEQLNRREREDESIYVEARKAVSVATPSH